MRKTLEKILKKTKKFEKNVFNKVIRYSGEGATIYYSGLVIGGIIGGLYMGSLDKENIDYIFKENYFIGSDILKSSLSEYPTSSGFALGSFILSKASLASYVAYRYFFRI